MTIAPDLLECLRFLVRVTRCERAHLASTDQRVFAKPFSSARARQLDVDADLSERVGFFIARFSRLQDTLGDKFVPALLRALGEPVGAAIETISTAPNDSAGSRPRMSGWPRANCAIA